MTSRKGFTLIELMVVVFIVGILAAVAIPIMRGRIDAAKWSEGRAGAGSIRTAARAFCAEHGPAYTYDGTITLRDLGFSMRTAGDATSDLDGKYFTEEAYAILFTGYDAYTVTVTATNSTSADAPAVPAVVTLDNTGAFNPP
jgi:type IV pilus assembly protein PilA